MKSAFCKILLGKLLSLYLPYLRSHVPNSKTNSPLVLKYPHAQPGREPLRHILIGSPDGVQQAIHTPHILNHTDQLT
ncbi:hypothetical protein [Pseudanabaena sp. FACHB-2040]|uniref:hypothetical protein n=1 Tax=Pseudanabaena sp. FACHB-2040 TaxID=2692859 RepID=UPI001F550352|nr:hypothetical protein [Pseudanabaena sp. FACHB-2040]